MELTINIREKSKVNFILELMQSFNYIDILNKTEEQAFSAEQQVEINRRLSKLKNGESKLYSWEEVKTEIQA